MYLCRRFLEELKLSPFGIEEYGGLSIDVAQTFVPKPGWLSVIVKGILFEWSSLTLLQGLINHRSPKLFYFAFLTNWSLSLTVAYFGTSLLNSLSHVFPRHISTSNQISWFLFGVAAPAEILVSVLFWMLVYDGGPITYRTVMIHGVFALLLLMEGLILNRIPIRASQFKYFVVYSNIYLAWTLLHAYMGIGDPTSEDDDTIYSVIQWNQKFHRTLVITCFIEFLGLPFFFGTVWALSLYSCPFKCDGSHRRFLKSGSKCEELVPLDQPEEV